MLGQQKLQKICKYSLRLDKSFRNNKKSDSLNYLTHLKYHVGGVGSSIEDIEKIFNELQKLINDKPEEYTFAGKNRTIAERDITIKESEEKNLTLTSEKENLEEQIKTLNEELTNIKSAQTGLDEQCREKTTELEQKNAELIILQNQLMEKTGELEQKTNELGKKIDKNEKYEKILKEILEINEDVNTLSDDKLQEYKNKINAKISSNNAQIEQLELEKRTLEEEKKTLEEEKRTLETEKTRLEEEKSTLEEEKLALEAEKLELNEKIQTLKAENETLDKSLQEQKSKNDYDINLVFNRLQQLLKTVLTDEQIKVNPQLKAFIEGEKEEVREGEKEEVKEEVREGDKEKGESKIRQEINKIIKENELNNLSRLIDLLQVKNDKNMNSEQNNRITEYNKKLNKYKTSITKRNKQQIMNDLKEINKYIVNGGKKPELTMVLSGGDSDTE